MANVVNLRIATGRSDVYYPNLRPIIVQATVEVSISVEVDPATQETLILISSVAGADLAATPLVSVDLSSQHLLVIDSGDVAQVQMSDLRTVLYVAGDNITVDPLSGEISGSPPVIIPNADLLAGDGSALQAITLDSSLAIADNILRVVAEELSVAHADTADSATTANSANTANSATTATTANSANSANTANTANSATTAGRLTTPFTLTVSGDASGDVEIDGSADVELALTVPGFTAADLSAVINNTSLYLDGDDILQINPAELAGVASADQLTNPFTLNVTGAGVGSVSINGAATANLTLAFGSVPTPTAGDNPVNKAYVDTLFRGIDTKPTADAATLTGGLPNNPTYALSGGSHVGATLTAASNGLLTVDGVALNARANMRVLVKNTAGSYTATALGLYVVTDTGAADRPYVLTRDPTLDESAEFPGALIAVDPDGGSQHNTFWLCDTNPSGANFTLGSDTLGFIQINPAISYNFGAGITVDGFNIALDFGTDADQVLSGDLLAATDGIATLGSDGKLTAAQLPAINLSFTGDVEGSGAAGSPINLNLIDVVEPGTYNSVTVDAQGRVVEGSSVSFTLPDIVTAATHSKITYNTKGLITAGADIVLADISNVAIASLLDKQIIRWDAGSGKFINSAITADMLPTITADMLPTITADMLPTITADLLPPITSDMLPSIDYDLLPAEVRNVPVALPFVSYSAEEIRAIAITQNMQLPANFAGVQYYAETAATDDRAFSIGRVHGGVLTTIGSVTITPTGITLSTQAAVNFNAGDAFRVVAPAEVDDTLANFCITFVFLKL